MNEPSLPVREESPAAQARIAILLVEDEESLGRVLSWQLREAGHLCTVTSTLAEARAELERSDFDAMLLDNRLPDGLGIDFLAELREAEATLPVVMLTSFASVEDAVRAIKLGAVDYLAKPEHAEQTLLLLEKALRAAAEASRLRYAAARDRYAIQDGVLLGSSPATWRLREEIERVATLPRPTEAPLPTVLLLGETGTGKGLAAKLLHRSGPCADRPYVQVDCAALPRSLIETELFGHEKGAFTQATHGRSGLLEAAEDGTIFLDEVGELPLDVQAKLLSVLDRRRIRRVGSTKERVLRARVIAATNRDLSAMAAEGRFRSDLLFRLDVLSVTLPPLRERGGDALELARAFAAETSRKFALPVPVIEDDAAEAIAAYPWPGNVRELKHFLERAMLLSPDGRLRAAALGLDPEVGAGVAGSAPSAPTLNLAEAERELVEKALEQADGNVSEAARRLGLSRGALRNRIARYGL